MNFYFVFLICILFCEPPEIHGPCDSKSNTFKAMAFVSQNQKSSFCNLRFPNSINNSSSSSPTITPPTTAISSPTIGFKTYSFTINEATGGTAPFEYRVYLSPINEINTLADVETNLASSMVRDYATSRTISLTGLTTLQFYTVHIIAKDANGTKSLFTPYCIQTNPHFTGAIQCKAEPGNTVTTVTGNAGDGLANGTFATALIRGPGNGDGPKGLAIFQNNLYLPIRTQTPIKNGIVKVDILAGQITIVAGGSTGDACGDNASGLSATFSNLQAITSDLNLLYFRDRTCNTFRTFNPITTAVATGNAVAVGGSAMVYDGDISYYTNTDTFGVIKLSGGVNTTLITNGASNIDGALPNPARINTPGGMAFDRNFMYIGASGGDLRKVDLTTNTISTLLTLPASFGANSMALYGNSMYILAGKGCATCIGVIYKYDIPSNTISLFAGSETVGGTVDGNRLTTARIHAPSGILFYGNTLYFTQMWDSNGRLRKIE